MAPGSFVVGDTVRTVVGEAVVGSDVEGGVGAMLGDTAAAAVEELVEALVGRSIGLWVGARVAGAKHPQISRKAVTLVLRVASTKPLCPARWKLKHEGGGCPATSTIPSGLVIRTVGSLASQTLQRGKPGKGGSAADTGAAVMGAGVTGAVMAGAGMVGTTVATGATVHGAIHPHAPRTKKNDATGRGIDATNVSSTLVFEARSWRLPKDQNDSIRVGDTDGRVIGIADIAGREGS